MTSSRSSLSVQLPACVCVRVGWYVCVSVATIVAARGTRMLAFCWRRLDTSTHYNHTFNGSTYAGCNYSGATCGLSMPACGTWGPCLTAAHGTAPTRTTSGCASCRGVAVLVVVIQLGAQVSQRICRHTLRGETVVTTSSTPTHSQVNYMQTPGHTMGATHPWLRRDCRVGRALGGAASCQGGLCSARLAARV